ncbi:MAG TPA: dTDP-4-dehydrorhamnose 3,5-epimerase family protein [Gemmataceae bacterium]|jgi:dTDP-4-dehydrorhamnose 3,5-epimerase|nr:dTDP-4-dehydrorhamnose 3,5-epimerase family protein [Gemmataceae bacterium]
MQFHPGRIEGIIWRPLRKYHDARGWLCELFRHDELPPEFHPVMAYVSLTEPGVARGPHAHAEQADCFCFLGPSNFQVYLWDDRPGSPTYRTFETAIVGEDRPMLLIIPPGVVHAYKNVGGRPGLVFNCPNRLYKGPGRKDPVDEVRHENDPNSPFRVD